MFIKKQKKQKKTFNNSKEIVRPEEWLQREFMKQREKQKDMDYSFFLSINNYKTM